MENKLSIAKVGRRQILVLQSNHRVNLSSRNSPSTSQDFLPFLPHLIWLFYFSILFASSRFSPITGLPSIFLSFASFIYLFIYLSIFTYGPAVSHFYGEFHFTPYFPLQAEYHFQRSSNREQKISQKLLTEHLI